MTTRRDFLSASALAGIGSLITMPSVKGQQRNRTEFKFCLNTITVSKQPLGIIKYIDIAAEAEYDGVEIWVRDLEKYLNSGGSPADLKKYLSDKNISVENGIGFAPWLAEGEAGFSQMRREMEILASIGCKRIAATAAGSGGDKPLDLFGAGERYRELLKLGRETGVMPQLEFWGASKVLWHLGQALMIVAAAGDSDARILSDVYHMFRGNSSIDILKMIDGSLIEIFHMNDYVTTIPREQQKDSDRVYPGDGAAPLSQIITCLRNMGGNKVLSIELFNETYWKQDPLAVAKTGIQKLKKLLSDKS